MRKNCLRQVWFVALLVVTVAAKPNQLQEERREYQYQRSHKVTSTSTMDAVPTSYYNSRLGNYQTQDSSMTEWAQRHQEQVQRMAERMHSNFNSATTGAASMSTGNRGFSSSMAMTNAEDCDTKPAAFSYSFAGKSQAELDELAKTMTQKMIDELNSGQRRQSHIGQNIWSLHRGVENLDAPGSDVDDLQQQQQQIFSEEELRHATHGSRYTGGSGYSQQSYKNQEQTQESQHQVPVVVSGGGHYASSQLQKEEEERYRSYRPRPTQMSTSHSQSSSSQQSERTSQTVYPTPIVGAREHNKQSTEYERESLAASPTPIPVYSGGHYASSQSKKEEEERYRAYRPQPTPTAVVREHNKQSAEYERESLSATPTTIPVHTNSYFTQSLNERHRQYQRPRPIESASSTYHSNVEEEESHQRQIPVVMPLAHNSYASSSSSQVNKETETVPVVPQPTSYNYGRDREESSYTRDRTYVKPTLPTIQRQQQQHQEVIVETITHKPIINTGSSHQIYNYKSETDLKVSPLYKPAYVEKSHHEKFEEEQMRLRQQQQQRPVVTMTNQKEESETSRQRYRGQPQPVLQQSATSTSEAEDLQQVQQVVFEQPATDSLHTEMTEEERRRVIHRQRPSYGSYNSGFNRTEEAIREQRPVAAPVIQIATTHQETEEEREYRRQNPGQTIHTTTIEERNEEMRRRQQQQAEYDRQYAVSGYNRSESESAYRGGQYQAGAVGGHREYTLEERERLRQSGGGVGYYMETGYSKEEEERRRLEYERRQQGSMQTSYGVSESGGGSSHLATGQRQTGGQRVEKEEKEEVKFTGSTAGEDKTVYTSSYDGKDDDGQQKLVEVDETVTDSTDKSAKTIISKDRGDQPPQTFEEDYESEEVLEAEPGIGYYPADKKPETGMLRSTSRPRTTTPNPYFSAPLAPYTREHEKRRYESSSQVKVAEPAATETEEYRRHYQRTQQHHQYTSGNLYPQPKHAQQHELENVFTEETSELSVSPRPAVQTASETLHQMAGTGSSSSSSASSGSQSSSGRTNHNTHEQQQHQSYGSDHESDDLQQQQIAIFDVNSADADRGQSTVEWSLGGAQTNEKYAEVDNQEAEQRRQANAGNSTWNQETTYTFNVEKEIDADDYDNVQQQVQDMTKEFEDIGQKEMESLTQQREGHHQRSQQYHQSSYSRPDGHSSHASYEHLEAQEKDHIEEPAPEVTTEKSKSGFWKRFRNKAKDLVG